MNNRLVELSRSISQRPNFLRPVPLDTELGTHEVHAAGWVKQPLEDMDATIVKLSSQTSLIVSVRTRQELDKALDEAVDHLKPLAAIEGVGIRVTRCAPGRYEARLDDRVPSGTTMEDWGDSR